MKGLGRWVQEGWKERVPADSDSRPALLYSHRPEPDRVRIITRTWTRDERIRRGFRISFKILFPVFLALLPFAFLEPFIFMIWGSILYTGILAVAGPLLFARYFGEESSFFGVDSACPHCQASGPLRPFVSTRLEAEMTVLCRGCGQTSTVRTE